MNTLTQDQINELAQDRVNNTIGNHIGIEEMKFALREDVYELDGIDENQKYYTQVNTDNLFIAIIKKLQDECFEILEDNGIQSDYAKIY